jgi:hypothetical protein
MSHANWRTDVADLLLQTARAVTARQDKRAIQSLGTALFYLEKARAAGEAGAGEILERLRSEAFENPTERFTFAPGELEEITRRERL